MSLKFRIVFATACAVLAVLASVNYAELARADVERERNEALERYGGEVVSLVVANGALEPGQVVTASDVTERDWISDLAPEGAIRSVDDVVGREVTIPISKNAPVTELAFRGREELADVPDGCVAVSVAVSDKLGISRATPQGSELVAYEVTADGTRLIATGITVLSAPDTTGSFVAGTQVTLSVAADDAEAVLAAAASGDLRLAMPADDVDLAKPEAAKAPEAASADGTSAAQADAGTADGNSDTSESEGN